MFTLWCSLLFKKDKRNIYFIQGIVLEQKEVLSNHAFTVLKLVNMNIDFDR